jgi:crotonobetainyl-CoA:carnitine CoA-transferase CaiB-like acyl-CoA transferase
MRFSVETSSEAPLTGIRVLDLSRVLAGPYCTMVLADLGADVIKLERPGVGDETRTWGPPFAGGEATYYLAVNRGKRSIALDLADPRTRPALERLVSSSDVVVENFRAGVARRLGLDYDALTAIREDLIHCSITGFGSGRNPPDRPGYDFVAQAESGLMSITGSPDGPPTKVGVAVIDVLTGCHAAMGILSALHGQKTTGGGRKLEVSLLDTGLASLINVAQAVLSTGVEARRYENAHQSIVPYEPFETADGWLAVAAANDGLWFALCRALDRPDLAADERYATNPGRVEHRNELVRALGETFRTRAADDWLVSLAKQGVPAGKVRGVREAFEAAAEAGEPATMRLDHPTIGSLELVRSPIRVHPEPAAPPTPPPLLGQHTVEILRELQVDPEPLLAAGVVVDAAVSP